MLPKKGISYQRRRTFFRSRRKEETRAEVSKETTLFIDIRVRGQDNENFTSANST